MKTAGDYRRKVQPRRCDGETAADMPNLEAGRGVMLMLYGKPRLGLREVEALTGIGRQTVFKDERRALIKIGRAMREVFLVLALVLLAGCDEPPDTWHPAVRVHYLADPIIEPTEAFECCRYDAQDPTRCQSMVNVTRAAERCRRKGAL